MDDPQLSADPLGPLADDFVARLRRGERPAISDYCQQNAELAERIHELFPRLVLIEQFGSSERHLARVEPALAGAAPPTRIGDYTLVCEIGRGGMGIVYEAVHDPLGRRVALKVLPRHTASDARSWARFQSEARAAARLHHTNIVPVFEVGQDQGYCFIAMQIIEGIGLDALIRERRERQAASGPGMEASSAARHRFREVARIGLQLAEALEHAHRRGVLHRDIKPSNVLVDDSMTVWITDFGLAKTDGEAQTQTGDVAGTIRYMAPERFQRQSDPRSDIYGVGATLYELLTLCPVFDADDYLELMRQVLHGVPRRPRQMDSRIPRDLETIILKALEREPSARYASAGRLAEDLRLFLADLPIRARRASPQERVRRWCARNPAVAALTLTTGLALVVGMGATAWKWREAETAWTAEYAARQAADAATQEVSAGLARLKLSNTSMSYGNLNAAHRRWDDSEAAYARAIELRPDHVRVFEERAHRLYLQLGLFDLALADLRQAFELQRPVDASSWHTLALLQVHAGDGEAYERLHDELCVRFARITSYANPPWYLRAAALAPLARGMQQDTLLLADAVLQTKTDNPQFAYLAGLVHGRAGHFDQSIRLCTASIESAEPWVSKPMNWCVLAIAQAHLGRTELARGALTQAEAALDAWTAARLNRDLTSWLTDMSAPDTWPVPVEDFLECAVLASEARRLLDLPPVVDPRSHVLRGRAFSALRRWNSAVAEYEAAERRLPGDEQVRLEAHRARAYQRATSGSLAAAADEFSATRRLSPHDSDLWRFEAFARIASHDRAAYRAVCQEMLGRFRGTPWPNAAYDVVDACVRGADAVDDMPALLELARLGATWYVGGERILGAALYRAGRHREAIEAYEAASRLIPLRADDLLFLALAHHALGQRSAAWARLRDAEAWMEAANVVAPGDFSAGSAVWGDWYERIFSPQFHAEVRATLLSHAAPGGE